MYSKPLFLLVSVIGIVLLVGTNLRSQTASMALTTAAVATTVQNETPLDSALGDLDEDLIPELVVVYNLPELKDSFRFFDDEALNFLRKIVIFKQVNSQWEEWRVYNSCLPGATEGHWAGDPLASLEVVNGELLMEFVYVGKIYYGGTKEKYRLRHGDLYLSEFIHEVYSECADYSIIQIDVLNSLATVEEGINNCEDEDMDKQINHKDIYKVICYPISLMNRNQTMLKVKNVETNEIIEYRQF